MIKTSISKISEKIKENSKTKNNSLLLKDINDFLNPPKEKEEKKNIFNNNFQKNVKPTSIKKKIEFKNNQLKKLNFEFTQKEFKDNFSNVKEFSDFYFYKNKEKINKIKKTKKNNFSNEKFLENFSNLRILNLNFFLDKFKIYNCKYCDKIFMKHTNLGGHISRGHFDLKKKIKKKKVKKNIIEKRRMKFLKNI